MRKVKLPKGYKDGQVVKIAVGLDPELFERVCGRAKDTNISFSQTVRDLLKCGLLCIEESIADDEPKAA